MHGRRGVTTSGLLEKQDITRRFPGLNFNAQKPRWDNLGPPLSENLTIKVLIRYLAK